MNRDGVMGCLVMRHNSFVMNWDRVVSNSLVVDGG